MLAIGFICFIPLGACIYMYDLYVQPQHSTIIYTMRSGQKPEERLLNYSPWLASAKKLKQEKRSLENRIANTPETDPSYYKMVIELSKYRTEHYTRMILAFILLVNYILFASVGYLSRHQTIKKILGVLAVIIVAVTLISSINRLVTQYLENAPMEINNIRRNM